MARIPSVEESTSSEFTVPDMGAYTVQLASVEDAGVSKMYGNNQELFKWAILDEGPFKGELIFNWVNVDSFYNGKGKQSTPAVLYRIVRALQGDRFDEKQRPDDTQDLVGMKCRILLAHTEAGKPKIERYQAMVEQQAPAPVAEAVGDDDSPF
jgi:hypothetical protein